MTMIQSDAGAQRPNERAAADIRAAILASDRALLAADEAQLREALNGVRWERRGLLQRLTRSPR